MRSKTRFISHEKCPKKQLCIYNGQNTAKYLLTYLLEIKGRKKLHNTSELLEP